MIEHRLQLENAQIREIRYKGRGIIKLVLEDYRKVMLIRWDIIYGAGYQKGWNLSFKSILTSERVSKSIKHEKEPFCS